MEEDMGIEPTGGISTSKVSNLLAHLATHLPISLSIASYRLEQARQATMIPQSGQEPLANSFLNRFFNMVFPFLMFDRYRPSDLGPPLVTASAGRHNWTT